MYPATCPHSYPDESTPLHYTIFIYDPFNIILPSNLILPKGSLRDFRPSPRSRWDLRSSAILRSVRRLPIADVSGQPIGPHLQRLRNSNFGFLGLDLIWFFFFFFLHLDGLLLHSLTQDVHGLRWAYSTVKLMFGIRDVNTFFVHIKYWEKICSLSFDRLCAIIPLSKSDVWLTVHRNSVWIRKTN